MSNLERRDTVFVKIVYKNRWRTAIALSILITAAATVLTFPAAVAGGISRGLSICSSVIIPSLFPFLVLSGVIVRSGIATAIGNRLDRLTRRVFGLPGCCAGGILIGFFGGYPAGAVAIGELVRSGQLSKTDAKHMLRFCVNGGPGFVISAVGATIMNSTAFGWMLFAAHLVSSLIIGIIGAPCRKTSNRSRRSMPSVSFTVSLVESVTAACQTLLSLCGFVVLFAAILTVADACGIPSHLSLLLSCLLEVNCGCLAAAEITQAAPFLLGCTIGFGGLCVHCQLAAALHGTGVMSPSFFLSRIAHALLTGLLTVWLLQLFPLSLSVGSSLNAPLNLQTSYGGVTVSVALLILCGVWMLILSPALDKGQDGRYNIS
ncbi:MAG: hypothetical protein J6Q42_03145 [Clostridia bacterium]|nr:hypothetical protein [Clostridia bacterium]